MTNVKEFFDRLNILIRQLKVCEVLNDYGEFNQIDIFLLNLYHEKFTSDSNIILDTDGSILFYEYINRDIFKIHYSERVETMISYEFDIHSRSEINNILRQFYIKHFKLQSEIIVRIMPPDNKLIDYI